MKENFNDKKEIKKVNTIVTKAILDAMLACAEEFGVEISYDLHLAEIFPAHIPVTYSHNNPLYDFSNFGKKYRKLLQSKSLSN